MNPNIISRRLASVLGMACLAGTALVAAQGNSAFDPNRTYYFGRKAQVAQIEPYNTVVFSRDNHTVHTMRGEVLFDSKNAVRQMATSPAGASMFIITTDKKGQREGALYSTHTARKRLKKFDSKRLGEPIAAVYTPDARSLIVCTDRALWTLDSRTLEPKGAMLDPALTPAVMAVSPNGYLLAMADGEEVAVYNLEDQTLRKTWDNGGTVADIDFAPDSSELAVLLDDGTLTLYGTRALDLRKSIDVGADGLAADYNQDGKYMAVATSPNTVVIEDLLKAQPYKTFAFEKGGVSDVCFITDSEQRQIMAYPQADGVYATRLGGLQPFYNKLVADEVDQRMSDWLKMMPGESMADYALRVNEETRAAQRRLFEQEISTNLAGDLLGAAHMTLGAYDRAHGVLALEFETMPTIYLPVQENELGAITDASVFEPVEVRYGLMPDDTFEIVYAVFRNTNDGKTYTYDNTNRVSLDYMTADDAVSIEVLQQQQMEEIRLQELREEILEEARRRNVISNHTDIAVDSRIESDYDANGNRILNYLVNFTYTVDPEFSATEDFGPGKYMVEESGAATSMLNIVKEAFEGDFAQHLQPGKKVKVTLTGTADATPVIRTIPYSGVFGEYEDEPVRVNGDLSTLTVTSAGGVKSNEQLALLRALGVRDYLEKNVKGFGDMKRDYEYRIDVSEDKGSAFRRINAQFVFVDVF